MRRGPEPGSPPRATAVFAVAAALVALAACGRGGSTAHAREAAPPPASAPPPDRLPEDPVAGAKATAQWHEHMALEERERQLRYDRERIPQHREVLRLIAAARARCDRAKTRAAVATVEAQLPRAIDDVRRRITAIDHWGVNSNVLGDYDAMLTALRERCPAARRAALAGDRAALRALRADLDARRKKIADWLAEAAAIEDE